MNPFYFSYSKAPLYGVLHEPTDGPFRDKAILFCHPVGHEYFRTNRMIQLLASKLATQGYYSLRFDYHGTGDSSGKFADVDMKTWQQDITDACHELRSTTDCDQVLCIGLRLGAALALQVHDQCNFNELILWDPILEGQAFLNQLNSLQHQVFRQNWHFKTVRQLSDLSDNEYLGYCYSLSLHQQLQNLSLSNEITEINRPCTIIHTDLPSSLNELNNQNKHDSFTLKSINDEGNWDSHQDIDRSISTHNINHFILESLS
jgi:exosortase A-associated hydrolase 2